MAGSKNFDPATIRAARRNIEEVVEAGKRAMVAALPVIGMEATNVIKILLTHPSPSAPGEPPGLVFGGARLSYDYDTGGSGNRHHVAIGSDAATRRPVTGEAVNYVKYLETGTSRMAARPHLRPGMAIVAPTIGPTLSRAATAAMRARAASLKGTSSV